MMMLRIDSNGYFVEDVLVDGIPTIEIINEDDTVLTINDPSYISVPCQEGFYKPKWDGDKWIEGKVFTTEDAYAEKIQLILKASQDCNARILAGFESDCLGEPKMFDCEVHDQSTIQGLTITAMLGLQGLTQEETHWKATGELECYKFEYTQILKLATDLKKHVEKNINQFNAERLAILNG